MESQDRAADAEREAALAAAYRDGYEDALKMVSAQLAEQGIQLQVKREPVATGA